MNWITGEASRTIKNCDDDSCMVKRLLEKNIKDAKIGKTLSLFYILSRSSCYY